MRTTTTFLASLSLLFLAGSAFPREEETGLDDEGFITTWLLLAPIPLEEGQRGADALDKEQVKGEAALQPKASDKVTVGGKELVWKKYKAKEHFFDFNGFLGKVTEDSAGYAVCYIHAPEEMKNVKLKTGSDDQSKIYLHGKQVLRQDEDRPLELDQDTVEVTLKKGANVLVFKVINEKEDWSGCARFMDANDKVIKNLKVTTTAR
jgi:hypothetical protein